VSATRTAVSAWANEFGLLVIRSMVGIVFVFHGAQKLFGWFGGGGLSGTSAFMEQIGIPLPAVSAFMAGGTEFFGGLALILGLWTRLVAWPLIITMIVAVVKVHGGAFGAQQGGMEYPLTLAMVLLGLSLTGGGQISVTALLGQKKPASSAAISNASSADVVTQGAG
jgi:putative oxidoreductase